MAYTLNGLPALRGVDVLWLSPDEFPHRFFVHTTYYSPQQSYTQSNAISNILYTFILCVRIGSLGIAPNVGSDVKVDRLS